MANCRMTGKRDAVISEGREITRDTMLKLHSCNNCGEDLVRKGIWQCKNCKAVKYCDRKCQREHWPNHKVLCRVITKLSEINKSHNEMSLNSGHFQTHLTPKQHAKVTSLVGKKCVVKYRL